ncbi:MAG: ABC transporter substrate-binding protein [Anaerolinea sp.]|nr:ABC transporter substrate-binding protein [Anaerolinea sp.]
MKSTLRNPLVITLLIMLIIGMIGIRGPVQAQDDQDNKIRLGFIPVVIYAPIFVAQERGYFTEEGVAVEMIPVPAGGGDSVIQLAAGNFDVAATGAGAPLWNAAYQGLGFKIVAPLHTERPPLSTPLVISAKRTEEIKTIVDLKGKTIAINNTGSAIEYWVYAALKKGGLRMDEVNISAMPFPQMPAALEAGAIDAAVITDPLATLAVQQGTVAVLADDYIDGITVTYVFMGLPLLEERPAMAEGFIRGYLRGARDLQGDGWLNEDTAKIIEKYTQVPVPAILNMNRPYFDPNGVIPVPDLEEVQRYFLSRGTLEYKEALDVSTFIDDSLMKKAVETLGEVSLATAEPGR